MLRIDIVSQHTHASLMSSVATAFSDITDFLSQWDPLRADETKFWDLSATRSPMTTDGPNGLLL